MAKLEMTLEEKFDTILSCIEKGVPNNRASMVLKEQSDIVCEDVRCSIRVFAQRAYEGVTLSIVLLQKKGCSVHLSAMTASGSLSVFGAVRQHAEKTVLDGLKEVLGIEVRHWYDD